MRRFIPLLLLLVALITSYGPTASASAKPNLIIVLADDLSAKVLSCYGGESVKTPVLDELADGGMLYTHCYSPALCMPSRTELLTGKYSHRNFLGRGHLAPGETNIASELKKAGYATCQVEKWHLNINNGSMPPQAAFDEYYHTKLSHNYESPIVDVNGKETKYPGGYGPDVCQEFAFDFIERHREQPFFLYYAIHLPHSPYHVPPGRDADELSSHEEKYLAMVEHMDLMMGQLVDHLESLKLREETLLIFLGDNGTPKGFTYLNNGTRLAGGKASQLDSGTHVPMIVSWPGNTPVGVVTDNLIDFSDFLPTARELAGLPPKPALKLDGQSFLPQLLAKPNARVRSWAFNYGVQNGGKGAGPTGGFWARTQRWKLYDDGDLFDMVTDPLEESPILEGGDSPEAEQARRRLNQVLQESGAETATKRYRQAQNQAKKKSNSNKN